MKKIGLVGGIAWPSTVDYYAGICRLAEAAQQGQTGAHTLPEMSIESLDHHRAVAYLGHEGDATSWAKFDAYHREALQRLERSGAEVAAIASNTSHNRFPEITAGVRIPVISVFEVMAAECTRLGEKRALILGTATTMASARLCAVFASRGIAAAGPGDKELRALTVQLSEELQHGMNNSASSRLADIVRRCAAGGRIPLVCLACTELPLAFPGSGSFTLLEYGDIRYLNSSAVHMRAIFDHATSG